MRRVTFACIAVTACLAACGHYARPPYEPPAAAQRARITVDQTDGDKWVCIDGMQRTIQADKSGYGVIPAGRRITVGSYFYTGDDRRTFSCNPRLSFVPSDGASYHLEFGIEGNRCLLSVFREDSTRRTGVALDTSMAPGDASCVINDAPTPIRNGNFY